MLFDGLPQVRAAHIRLRATLTAEQNDFSARNSATLQRIPDHFGRRSVGIRIAVKTVNNPSVSRSARRPRCGARRRRVRIRA